MTVSSGDYLVGVAGQRAIHAVPRMASGDYCVVRQAPSGKFAVPVESPENGEYCVLASAPDPVTGLAHQFAVRPRQGLPGLYYLWHLAPNGDLTPLVAETESTPLILGTYSMGVMFCGDSIVILTYGSDVSIDVVYYTWISYPSYAYKRNTSNRDPRQGPLTGYIYYIDCGVNLPGVHNRIGYPTSGPGVSYDIYRQTQLATEMRTRTVAPMLMSDNRWFCNMMSSSRARFYDWDTDTFYIVGSVSEGFNPITALSNGSGLAGFVGWSAYDSYMWMIGPDGAKVWQGSYSPAYFHSKTHDSTKMVGTKSLGVAPWLRGTNVSYSGSYTEATTDPDIKCVVNSRFHPSGDDELYLAVGYAGENFTLPYVTLNGVLGQIGNRAGASIIGAADLPGGGWVVATTPTMHLGSSIFDNVGVFA